MNPLRFLRRSSAAPSSLSSSSSTPSNFIPGGSRSISSTLSRAALVTSVLLSTAALTFAQTQPAPGRTTVPSAQPSSKTNPKVQDGQTLQGPKGAQGTGQSIALPLASVGRAVGWRIDPDDFRINVPAGAAARTASIEVFSPEINRNDYANARNRVTYYGDELYGKSATLRTAFNLKAPGGNTLFERSYDPGTTHSYEALYDGVLQAGFYPLTVVSNGNGKNSFAIRATAGYRVEASQFTVNARGQFNQDQLVAFVELGRTALGKTVKLSNYDADGDQEMVLTLVAPNGKRYQLTASPDTQWATNALKVTNELVGTWKILGRILPTTRQFSNAFAFRLRLDDKPLYAYLPGFQATTKPVPPLKVEVVDPGGRPIAGSSFTVTGSGNARIVQPVLPNCYTPVSASILEGQGKVDSSTRVSITSANGRIRFVANCPKATLQISAVALVCGQRSPVSGVNVSVAGQTVKLPGDVNVEPGSVTVTPAVVPGATASPITVTAEQGKITPVTVEYKVTPSLNLTPTSLELAQGQTATLTAIASTDFPSPIPAIINVTLPDGLEATGPVRLSGNIAASKSLTLRIPVRATKAITSATIRATLEPSCGISATSTIGTNQIDLALTKTVNPATVNVGGNVTYTMTVSNNGPSNATKVIVRDPFPRGVQYVSATSTRGKVAYNNGVLTVDVGNLPVGQSATITAQAKVTQAGSFTNTAEVRGAENETNLDNNRASATVQARSEIDLAITKSVNPKVAQVGANVTYTIIASNNGPSNATGVVVSDPLPDGLTYISASSNRGTASFANGTVTANIGSLARGSTATITVRATAARPGKFTNTATIKGTEFESKLENNSASAELEIGNQIDLAVVKRASPSAARIDDTVSFIITTSNNGPSNATGVVMTDALPDGLTYVDSSTSQGQVSASGSNVTVNLGDLGVGQSATVTVRAKTTRAGRFTNTASVKGNEPERQLENNNSSATVEVGALIDLALTKAVSPSSAGVGDSVVYTIVASNNGPSNATGVVVSDPLPDGLTYGSSSSSVGNASFAGNTVTANLGNLAVGQSATITVRATTTRGGRLTNTATVKGNEPETSLTNNSASAVLEGVGGGSINANAFAVTCGARTAVPSAGFTINGTRYTTPAQVRLPAGEYTLQPDAIPGATVQSVRVTVTGDQSVNADLLYIVTPNLELSPNLSLANGQTGTVTATASTAFPYAIPARINVTLPSQLTTSSPTTVSGNISANNPLTLRIPVRASGNVVAAPITANLEPNCNVSDSSTVTISRTALPEQRRESEVVLLARLQQLPNANSTLILSDRVPNAAKYVAGSSRLVSDPRFSVNTPTNSAGNPISDPYVAGDRLFWLVPLGNDGVPNLQWRRQQTATGEYVYGITYRLAHSGALEMPADRVAVISAVSGARSAGDARGANASIKPDSALGKLIGAGDLFVLQGDPSVLGELGQAIPFDGNGATAATTTDRPVGGPATTVRVRVERPTTDRIDQPQIVVEAFDANVLPANDAYATIETNVDLVEPDAQPSVSGYQVALENGLGRVRVQNLSGGVANSDLNPIREVKVEARVANDNGIITSSTTYRVNSASSSVTAPDPLAPTSTNTTAPDRPVVAVGLLGVGGSINLNNGEFTLDGGFRFALRGSVFPGANLTVGINWQATFLPTFGLSGDLLPEPNPFNRFPITGDSSQIGSDIRSTEGFYAKLEFGQSYVLYGSYNPAYTGVLSSYNANYNGLQALIRGDGIGLNVFATDTPLADQRFRRQADGTDLIFLTAGVSPLSERVVIVTNDRSTGEKLREVTLNRNADYTIDYTSGVVRLGQGVTSQDPNGNPQFIQIEYANTKPAPDFRAGAQVNFGSQEGFSATATALQFRNGQFGGNSSLLFGAGIKYSSGGFNFGVEGALSGPFDNQGLGIAAALAYNTSGFGVRVNYQDRDPNFINPESNTVQSGRSLTAGLLLGDPNGFRFTANGEHTQQYVPTSPVTNNIAGQIQNNFGGGFTIGLGLAYNSSSNNTGAFSEALRATLGVEIPLGFAKLSALQRSPLFGTTGEYGDTTVTLEIPLSKAFSLRLSDKLTYAWNGIRQQFTVGASGAFSNSELIRTITGNEALVPEAFGQTNVSANYDISSVDGNAGRARVGLDTKIPLSDTLSLQVAGEAVFSPDANSTRGSASLGLLYNDSGFKAVTRAQLSFLPQGTKQVYTAGFIAQLSDEFTISPTVEYAIDPSSAKVQNGGWVTDGGFFSVAFAYRGWNWSILSNHTGRFGLYSPAGDKIEGEIQFGYQASEVLFWNSGLAYRFVGTGFTGQVSSRAQYFLSDSLFIGAQGAVAIQPYIGYTGYALGLEGGLKIVDNLLFTLGFNFVGFNTGVGIGTSTFTPGVYFRLDWKIDERTFGWGR